MLDLILKNAKMVTPTGVIDSDLGILDGKIAKTGTILEKAKIERDCTGLFILPGVIDMHVHFRDPGNPQKETFETGSAAAIAGGITTVIDMPNTKPPTTTLSALEQKRAIAAATSHVNYGFYMGFTGENLDEIRRAKNIAGVKVYTASSIGNLFVQDHHLIEQLFVSNIFTILHAEKETIIREYEKKHKGNQDPSVHSLIRCPLAAYQEVKEILHCAKKYNARIHITHVSTKEEIEELRKFKGPNVSTDCTPHHLYLTEKAYVERGNFVKVNPPLRREKDRQALWRGLREDIIHAVASDHAPHTKAEKELSYSDAPAGVPGVETLLPLLLDSVNHGELSLRDLTKITSENPARILGIKNKGRIEAGYDADIIVVDINKTMEVGKNGFFTKCNWSPFYGWKLKGWPVMTVVGGVIVFENNTINKTCRGQEVIFSTSPLQILCYNTSRWQI